MYQNSARSSFVCSLVCRWVNRASTTGEKSWASVCNFSWCVLVLIDGSGVVMAIGDSAGEGDSDGGEVMAVMVVMVVTVMVMAVDGGELVP